MHSPSHEAPRSQQGGPFCLDDRRAYGAWRAAKLAGYPRSADALRVAIADLANPSPDERIAVRSLCAKANMAFYSAGAAAIDPLLVRPALRAFAAAFGLRRSEHHRSQGADGAVPIEVATSGGRADYVPYSNKPLSWHTDGYYNYHGPSDCVQSMLLHCVRDAPEGGVNALLDHEIAYIRLRDRAPDLLAALMHPQAVIIPAGEDGHGDPRPDNAGPVFFVEPVTQALVMRYTARKRHVVWRDDVTTKAAAKALEEILESDPLIVRAKLRPGEGLICNNILHNRTGFEDSADGPGRLLYRLRFHDRVTH